MQHRAGLPLHWQFIYEYEPYQRPTMEETIFRYGIVVRPPGEAFNYANLDYGVIEYLIERMSGLSYEDFMRREVFVPLGLPHTAVGPTPDLRDVTAALYDRGKRLPFMDFDQRGAGYVYSSAHDLVRFGMFHLKEHLADQGQILKDSTIDAMASDAVPTGVGNDSALYGLGWGIHPNEFGPGIKCVRHLGGMPGGTAALKLIPSKRIVVVVLANSNRTTTESLSDDIVATLIPEYRVQRAKQASEAPPSAVPFRPTAELVGAWKGVVKTWSSELPVLMEIKPDGDIHIKLSDQLPTLLDNVTFSDGELNGSFQGTIPTEDANRDRHSILLNRLVLRGDTLAGAAIADAGNHYGLPSYITLVRQSAAR
jgi:CubicO group peptidase (beta-lactamase class C family)